MAKVISNRELAERLSSKANGECTKCVCDGYCTKGMANCPETILQWLTGTVITTGESSDSMMLHN